MYDITYELDAVLHHMTIKADDALQAHQFFTNMYGSGFGNIKIIDIRRI